MLPSYQEFEAKVYRALSDQRITNPNFTFSVRINGSKGSELDYFIGTQKSSYFGFTSWFIPIYYPGSSSDLVDYIFRIDKNSISFHFEAASPKNAVDEQLKGCLDFVQNLRDIAMEANLPVPALKEEKKFIDLYFYPEPKTFQTFDELWQVFLPFYEKTSLLVDQAIQRTKLENSTWIADRISGKQFEEFTSKMERRFQRYAYLKNTSTTTPATSDEAIASIRFKRNRKDRIDHPLNLILYGPPGTGKTYNTINQSLSIIGNLPLEDINKQNREELTDAFEGLMRKQQIAFVTFHQSFSYEDFVEGIKPVLSDVDKESVQYEITAGLFKLTAAKAAFEYFRENKLKINNDETYDFDTLYEAYIRHIEFTLEQGKEYNLKSKTDFPLIVKRINSNDSIVTIAKASKRKNEPAPKTKLAFRKLYDHFKTVDDIKRLSDIPPVNEVSISASGYWSVFNDLKKFEAEFKKNYKSTPEEREELLEYSDEQILKMFENGEFDIYINDDQVVEPYVLVIDEINRGNVSQIFGELITLLEDDKRLGKPEQLKVKLPYSKKEFGVPPNLYVIGTMNTADRSIESLDTALRRRFSFKEMLPVAALLSPKQMVRRLWNDTEFRELDWEDPDYRKVADGLYSLLDISKAIEEKYKTEPNDTLSYWEDQDLDEISVGVNGIDLQHLLKTMNSRVSILLNRDQTIGHAYFLKVRTLKSLKDVFADNIIPLLQEYFYGDYAKIGLVLGKGFVDQKMAKINLNMFADFYNYAQDFIGEKVYEIKDIKKMPDPIFISAIKILLRKTEAVINSAEALEESVSASSISE